MMGSGINNLRSPNTIFLVVITIFIVHIIYKDFIQDTSNVISTKQILARIDQLQESQDVISARGPSYRSLQEQSDATQTVNLPPAVPVELRKDILQFPPDTEATMGRWMKSWQPDVREATQKLVDAQVDMRDPTLIQHIQSLIVPPSQHGKIKYSRGAENTPQVKTMMSVLNKKRNGFFIECGAFDGERSSNTLILEKSYGWTGLLLEVDPYFYMQVLGRNRRSYSLNACLSPSTNPVMLTLKEDVRGQGQMNKNGKGLQMPCYPLYSILKALNVTKVDFFSLDVEGMELPILKTIPFDEIDITTLTVEYNHGAGKQLYRDYMESQGYRVHKDIQESSKSKVLYVRDFFFVKKSFKPAR